ncbi:MAG: hypothetical protein Q7S40_17715 [Opitutaceae bacterium]|nr:hypothetical protein [Opitutaceae bacterium]
MKTLRYARLTIGTALILVFVALLSAQPASPPANDEQLNYERAYQQDLARRRAEEAKARARFDQERSTWPAERQYHALLEQARQYLARAEFQWAVRRYNEAMQLKPADLPVTPDVKQLQATLQAQNEPLEVTFKSDGATFVTISNFKPLRTFTETKVKILPGDYEIVGQRKGYRDVRIPLVLRNGTPPAVVSVACTEPATP